MVCRRCFEVTIGNFSLFFLQYFVKLSLSQPEIILICFGFGKTEITILNVITLWDINSKKLLFIFNFVECYSMTHVVGCISGPVMTMHYALSTIRLRHYKFWCRNKKCCLHILKRLSKTAWLLAQYWCKIFGRYELKAITIIWNIYFIKSKHFGQDDQLLWGDHMTTEIKIIW